jgi:sulfonate transport system ATP-binding protein
MLRVEGLTKQFPNGYQALAGVDLTVETGEILCVVGPSGCGKSTLLRILCGLDAPSGGTVTLDGRSIRGPQPEIGVMFQEPRLMPWLTVADNVEFGLRDLPRRERTRRSSAVLERVGLAEFAQSLPRELSGGMAQRAAIARALATRPQVFLLDEPFSALDAFKRVNLQEHLLDVWADARPTMILVTHDIEEALVLGDRVVLMRAQPGRIQADIRIDLPRPRSRTSPRFHALKDRLLVELEMAQQPVPPRGDGTPVGVLTF